MNENKPRLFLSHSSVDKPFVRLLAGELSEHGIRPWLDERELKPGDSIVSGINGGLDEADYVAVILSKASVASRWVTAEVNSALARQIAKGVNIVIPIRVEECEIPPLLQDRVYLDLKSLGLGGVVQQILRIFGLEVPPHVTGAERYDAEKASKKSVGDCPHSACEKLLVALSFQNIRRAAFEAHLDDPDYVHAIWQEVLGTNMISEVGAGRKSLAYWTELGLRVDDDQTLRRRFIKSLCGERQAERLCQICRSRFQ